MPTTAKVSWCDPKFKKRTENFSQKEYKAIMLREDNSYWSVELTWENEFDVITLQPLAKEKEDSILLNQKTCSIFEGSKKIADLTFK